MVPHGQTGRTNDEVVGWECWTVAVDVGEGMDRD